MVKRNLFLDQDSDSNDSEPVQAEPQKELHFEDSLKDSNLLESPTGEDIVPADGFYKMIECTIDEDDDLLDAKPMEQKFSPERDSLEEMLDVDPQQEDLSHQDQK